MRTHPNFPEKKMISRFWGCQASPRPALERWRLTVCFSTKEGVPRRTGLTNKNSCQAHRRTSKIFNLHKIFRKNNKMLHFHLCLLFVWSSHTWYLWVRNSVQKLEGEPIMINSSYKIAISTFTPKDFITKLSRGQKQTLSIWLHVEIPVLQIQGQDFRGTMAATARHVGMFPCFPLWHTNLDLHQDWLGNLMFIRIKHLCPSRWVLAWLLERHVSCDDYAKKCIGTW